MKLRFRLRKRDASLLEKEKNGSYSYDTRSHLVSGARLYAEPSFSGTASTISPSPSTNTSIDTADDLFEKRQKSGFRKLVSKARSRASAKTTRRAPFDEPMVDSSWPTPWEDEPSSPEPKFRVTIRQSTPKTSVTPIRIPSSPTDTSLTSYPFDENDDLMAPCLFFDESESTASTDGSSDDKEEEPCIEEASVRSYGVSTNSSEKEPSVLTGMSSRLSTETGLDSYATSGNRSLKLLTENSIASTQESKSGFHSTRAQESTSGFHNLKGSEQSVAESSVTASQATGFQSLQLISEHSVADSSVSAIKSTDFQSVTASQATGLLKTLKLVSQDSIDSSTDNNSLTYSQSTYSPDNNTRTPESLLGEFKDEEPIDFSSVEPSAGTSNDSPASLMELVSDRSDTGTESTSVPSRTTFGRGGPSLREVFNDMGIVAGEIYADVKGTVSCMVDTTTESAKELPLDVMQCGLFKEERKRQRRQHSM